MTWDPVPWMVEGGVKHSINVTRFLAYAAFGGMEGIISPLDLEVREREVPAGSIRVAPGACSILNRALNIEYEAYAARLPTEDYVDISPTGSGSGRTDLVVARVENPFLTGEPYPVPSPEDIEAGNVEFVRTHVIPNMPGPAAGTHPTLAQVRAAIAGMSAIPLASIAIPASIGTIAQGYIKDWRTMAQFREAQIKRVVNPGAIKTLSSATWVDIATVSVDIPSWATSFSGSAIIGGAKFTSPGSSGGTRVVLGTILGQTTGHDETTDKATDRTVLMTADGNHAIPAALRGTSQVFKVQGQKTGGTNMTIDSLASVSLDLTFHTAPEHDAT